MTQKFATPAIITRRSFIRTTGILGAGLALGSVPDTRTLAATSLTGIQNFTNNIGVTIDFVNLDPTSNNVNNRQIETNTTTAVSNAWVPWADSNDDFTSNNKQMKISNSTTNDILAQVWQSGDWVYYSLNGAGWSANASHLSGIGKSINLTLSGTVSKPKLSASDA